MEEREAEESCLQLSPMVPSPLLGRGVQGRAEACEAGLLLHRGGYFVSGDIWVKENHKGAFVLGQCLSLNWLNYTPSFLALQPN